MRFSPDLKSLQALALDNPDFFLPMWLEIPADILTPVSAFLRLKSSGSKEIFLLESADGGEEVGRFSFIGITPFASLKSVAGRLIYKNLETGENEEQDTSFQAVGAYLKRFKTARAPGCPPMAGASIGYFSYDCVDLLEKIPRQPGSYSATEINTMFFKTILIFDRLKHRLYLLRLLSPKSAHFESDIAAAKTELLSIKERLLKAAPTEHAELPEMAAGDLIPVESSLGAERYMAGVETIKEHIRRGDIFQCVLSDRFKFPVSVDSFLIYRMLRMINPSPYLYYLNFEDEVLLGSSPEMLVRTQGNTIETCPIAGTRPRGEDSAKDLKLEKELLANVKERAEHLMLVDLGRNDIGRVSKPGTVQVKSFMKVERYSHVMHLVSRVSGTLKNNLSPWDAFGSCFPAGTLSGAPKIRAMEILGRLEATQRGPYGGAIVCQDFLGDLNTCITIRSLYLKDGFGYAQAGAGIVADSKPDAEYEEVLNKARAIRAAVAAAHKAMRSSEGEEAQS